MLGTGSGTNDRLHPLAMAFPHVLNVSGVVATGVKFTSYCEVKRWTNTCGYTAKGAIGRCLVTPVTNRRHERYSQQAKCSTKFSTRSYWKGHFAAIFCKVAPRAEVRWPP